MAVVVAKVVAKVVAVVVAVVLAVVVAVVVVMVVVAVVLLTGERQWFIEDADRVRCSPGDAEPMGFVIAVVLGRYRFAE